jgi:hypothetical protein
MALDGDRNKFVIHGGSQTTYEWNSVTNQWNAFSPTPNPNYRAWHVMAYDKSHKAVILYGGSTDDQIWYWKAGAWGTIATTATPGSKYGATMAYDDARGNFVMFAADKRTWLLDTGAGLKPAITWDVPVSAIGGSGQKWRALDVKAYTGGYGYSGSSCSKVSGAQLLMWNKRYQGGGWLNVATNQADITDSAQAMVLPFSTTDNADIETFIHGPDSRYISMAMVPVSRNGCDPRHGKVAVDYVEMTVKYTLASSLPEESSPTYYVSTTANTWENARNDCVARGGDLVVIKNQAQNDEIKALLDPSRNYWMGMHSLYSQGEFRWVDGTPAWYGDFTGYSAGYGFTDWYTGEPNNLSAELCVGYYSPYSLKWVNYDCNGNINYICQIPSNNSLYLSTTTKTWSAARTHCQSMGKDLVMVKTGYEQYQLEQLLSPAASYWIGYTDQASEGIWKWVDGTTGWIGDSNGTPYGFNNWQSGQPDDYGGNQDFAYIWGTTGYKWDDNMSSANQFYICE